MMQVRRIKAKRSVDPLFEKDDVFVEMFDNHNMFYLISNINVKCGLDIDILKEHGGFDKYFEELESIPAVKTQYYNCRIQDMLSEISKIDESILSLIKRKDEILKLIGV